MNKQALKKSFVGFMALTIFLIFVSILFFSQALKAQFTLQTGLYGYGYGYGYGFGYGVDDGSYRINGGNLNQYGYGYGFAYQANPAKSITSFNFTSPSVMGVINETAYTITITVPYGTDVAALTPTIATSTGATVSPASGVAQDFTGPVTYTVTAADSSTQTYVVTVTVATNTVSGNITNNTIWTLANSPYIVTGTVQVLEGVKLTIEPGVIVKFNTNTGLNIGGELIASGTVDSIITFTSNQSTPKAGDWNGIKFFNTAVGANFDGNNNYINGSIVRYTKIAYAGGSIGSQVALDGGQTPLFIDNNIIELNKWKAIFVNDSKSKITNNIIRNNSLGTSKGDCGNGVVEVYQNNHYIENNIIDNNSLAGITLNNSNNSHVLNNEITNNGCGIKFYGSSNEIKNNLIDNNSSMGISYYSGSLSGASNIVRNNSIKNNGNTGIYFYKYNNSISKVEIINNNIFNNINYNFWLDDSSANIDAINNYWGTTNNVSIANKIYDYYDNIGLGKVIYEPYLIVELDFDDQTVPVITLIGSTPVNLYVGDTYTDAGATASDNVDGNITNNISVFNPFTNEDGNILTNIVVFYPVNMSEVGSYSVVYYVSDVAGNSAVDVTRTVNVLASSAKAITSFNFASPNVMGVINETAQTITITVPYGTDVTALSPIIVTSAGATISPASGAVQDFTAPVTYTVTAADTTTQTYIVTVNMVTATQTVPAVDGTATANSTTPQVVVSSPAQAVTVTVSSGTTNPTIDVSSFITDGVGTLPAITINSSIADVVIPATTLVTGPASWDGIIQAPISGTPSGGIAPAGFSVGSTVISVGSPDGTLTFDKAVTLLLPGVTGTVGYRPSGSNTWVKITNVCASPYSSPGNPPAGSECSINNGTDTKIVTYHFTSFGGLNTVSAPTPPSTPSSNSGSTSSSGGAPASTDTSAPTNVSVVINNGAAITTSRTVTLTLSASDASAIYMMISNDVAFNGVVWENYSTTKSWLLTDENGIKTVYIKFKDAGGNTSGVVNDSINLDFSGVIEEPKVESQVLGEKITDTFNNYIKAQKSLATKADKALTQRLAGRILLQVEDHGEAWYVDSVSQNRFYLADGAKAYGALRKFGLGITNKDLAKIPVGIEKRFLDIDTDADGLADKLEEGLGTDKNKKDTDGDGVSDYDEVIKNQTNPLGAGKLVYDNKLLGRLKGRIVLQVESRGEAWYINPADGKRYYMKDGGAAYQIMRFLSLGITNENLRKINIGD